MCCCWNFTLFQAFFVLCTGLRFDDDYVSDFFFLFLQSVTNGRRRKPFKMVFKIRLFFWSNIFFDWAFFCAGLSLELNFRFNLLIQTFVGLSGKYIPELMGSFIANLRKKLHVINKLQIYLFIFMNSDKTYLYRLVFVVSTILLQRTMKKKERFELFLT